MYIYTQLNAQTSIQFTYNPETDNFTLRMGSQFIVFSMEETEELFENMQNALIYYTESGFIKYLAEKERLFGGTK
jgi:hypothetical protein